MKNFFVTLVSFFFALGILLYLDITSLFLATLLIAIIAIKSIQNREDSKLLISKLIGIWFALSVAPAASTTYKAIFTLSNGFLLQALFSLFLFIYFYTTKPSIIRRLPKISQGVIGVIGADSIAGFTAGILSSLFWQLLQQFQTFSL